LQIRDELRADLKTYFPERQFNIVFELNFIALIQRLQYQPWTSKLIVKARRDAAHSPIEPEIIQRTLTCSTR
jgi:hypothetical protein